MSQGVLEVLIQLRTMPPVELNVVPPRAEDPWSWTYPRVVDKAMELPVVCDTLEKVKTTISDTPGVLSAVHMVEGGVHLVEGGLNLLVSNKTVESVKEAVLPAVTGALETLDNYACDGIDTLTHAVPALSGSTADLAEVSRDSAKGYLSWAKEYVASFKAAQLSLKVADQSLHLAEKTTGLLKPEKKDDSLACTTYARIRSLRRLVRALKRAGVRRNRAAPEPANLSESGLAGRMADTLAVNSLLAALGLELVPAKPGVDCKRQSEHIAQGLLDEAHTRLQDLKGDLEGYVSEDDPDYEPQSDLDDSLASEDGSDFEQEDVVDDGEDVHDQSAPLEVSTPNIAAAEAPAKSTAAKSLSAPGPSSAEDVDGSCLEAAELIKN